MALILTPPPRACLTRCHPASRSWCQREKRILYLNREKPWTVDSDLSRLDFMIACEILREGYHPQDVEHELSIGSPFFSSRKSGHINDYLKRTIWAASLVFHPLFRTSP